MKQDPNVIQITELQKLTQLETQDKYTVLEFLVKELMRLTEIAGSRKELRSWQENTKENLKIRE